MNVLPLSKFTIALGSISNFIRASLATQDVGFSLLKITSAEWNVTAATNVNRTAVYIMVKKSTPSHLLFPSKGLTEKHTVSNFFLPVCSKLLF